MDMDNDFQDRIDEFLLHGDTMSEEDKALFLKEIEEDAEKKERYEFTKSVKDAMASREDKLKAMTEFETEMKSHSHRRTLALVSGIAANAFSMDKEPDRLWDAFLPAYFAAHSVLLTEEAV